MKTTAVEKKQNAKKFPVLKTLMVSYLLTITEINNVNYCIYLLISHLDTIM